jgi:hypothetical protein
MKDLKMKDHNKKLSREQLIASLQTRGWDLVTGSEAIPVKNQTLEELARVTHARHKKGEAIGLIQKMETAIELDLLQIQELWIHLGLPI